MRSFHKSILLFIGIAFCSSACAPAASDADLDMEVTIESMPMAQGAFFPDSFTGGTEKVWFDCTLEVPEGFDPESFALPAVSGLWAIDKDAVYEKYVEGRSGVETYTYPPSDFDPEGVEAYLFQTGDELTGQVSIGSGFSYYDDSGESLRGGDIYPESAEGASRENEVSIGSGDACVAEVKETLAKFAYPVEEYEFSWFSLNAEELEALTQEKLLGVAENIQESLMEDWDVPEDGWSETDNRYTIYAWQYYGGLPVLNHWMSTDMASAKVTYMSAPIRSTYNWQGMIDLSADAPYVFEATGQEAAFLPFPEIASAVVRRYTYLLDLSSEETEEGETEEPVTYSVNRAMLAVRVYLDEKRNYAVEPVWYFEVQSSNRDLQDILFFNALNGKEIYLA